MNRLRTRMLLVVAGLVSGVAAAQAGPLELKRVAADAKWVAHVDVDAAKASPVVMTFVKECLAACDDPEHCPAMTGEWGFNPAKDLHSVTVYGSQHGPRHAVAVIQVDVDQKKCLQRLGEKVDLETTEHGGTAIYTWTKCVADHHHHRAMAFAKPNLVILARNAKLVGAALDVLEGKAEDLSGKESLLTAKTPEGTVFSLRAVGLDQIPGEFPVLKSLTSLDYVAGERKDQWTKEVTVGTISEETANQLKTVAEGWRAFVSLFFRDQPELVKLLSRAQFTVDGKMVRASIQAPDQEVIAQIPTICKFLRHHWQWHHRMHEEMYHHGAESMGPSREKMREKMEAMHQRMHEMMSEKMDQMKPKHEQHD